MAALYVFFSQSNVAMTSPIMSRFDLFFVIVDECDEVTDYNIARHITNMHQRLDDAVAADYTTDDVCGKCYFGWMQGQNRCRSSLSS